MSKSKRKRILLIQHEAPTWEAARPWTYCLHLGLEAGFLAQDVELVTLVTTWFQHAKEICGDIPFDQVWINDIGHSCEPGALGGYQITEPDMQWIASLAPIRVGMLMETIFYSEEDYQAHPYLHARLAPIEAFMKYVTHVLAGDEVEESKIESKYGRPSIWTPASVPSRYITEAPFIFSREPAIFSGNPYGERAKLLQNPELAKLLSYMPSPENQTELPGIFDRLNGPILAQLLAEPFAMDRYSGYLDGLRMIRRQAFEMYLEGLKCGSSVVNLPSFIKTYTGRVAESMAVGKPVVSWEIPDRPRTRHLFKEGSEILLYSHDEHAAANLATQLRKLQAAPALAQSLAINAREKLKRYHTVEARVGQLFKWIETGERPCYGESGDNASAVPPASRGECDNNFFIKSGYQSRIPPIYYEDDATEATGVVWQPDVYPLAAYLGKKYSCSNIIDMGCGHGQKLASLYPEFDVVGIDFGANIEYCRKQYPFGEWLEWNLEAEQVLPVDPNLAKRSIVISSDVIEHLINPLHLVRNIKSLLANAPVAIVSTPERDLTRGAGDAGPPANPCHVREWNLLELKKLLESEGIKVDFAGLTRSNTRFNAYQTTLLVLRGDRTEQPVFPDAKTGDSLSVINGQLVWGKATSVSDTPLVSVVMPTKNRPALLKHALDSVICQDYPNWEAIVVNDGGESVEDLVTTLDPHHRIRYISHRASLGLPSARNTALRQARGEIVCYLDDDDMFLPQHLSTVVKAMQQSGADFVYTDAEYVGEVLEHGERREVERTRPYENIQYSKEKLRIENFIPVNSWGHRWGCLLKTGFFDEGLPALEDWELLLRFSQNFDVIHVPKVTVEVRQRIDADNMSRQRRPDYSKLFRKIYQKYDDLGNETVRRYRELRIQSLEAEFPDEASKGVLEVPDATVKKGLSLEEVQKVSYQNWVAKHTLQEVDGQLLAERMVLKWTSRPVIHFVMQLHAGEEELLADTLDSLGTQMYPEWRLSVIAAFAAPSPVFSQFEMLQWIEVNQTVDVPEAINQMVNVMAADWLGFIPAGIRFTPQYLITCADYINIRPQWRLIYTDEDVIDKEGNRSYPKFKPDMNLDMLRSMPYFGSFLLRCDTFVEMGGYSRIAGLESYDLALRALDITGESAMGHIADVLFHMPAQIPVEPEESASKRVLAEHLHRNGIAGEVVEGYQPGTCRVIYQHADKSLVSIIIPTRDKLEFIRPCIESLFEKTDYPNFEVLLVDNQSDDPDVLEFYEEAKLRYGDQLRVIKYPKEFNFSAINNCAAERALGEYLLLLNNDTQIVQAEWLSRMMAYGQRPEVGVVGARLVYPETGKLQHAGVVLGMTRVADHPFNGILSINEPGYMNRAQIDQNYSAVTAACMLVRKSVYQSVGGMDEEKLKVLFNDVDLCLKVGQSGYKIVWTPYATVVHYGSTSLKGAAQDIMKMALAEERGKNEHEAMYARWMPKLSNDPAYNKNLSLVRPDYSVEGTVVIDWDTNFHDRPRILGVPLSGASGEYRIKGPFHALSHAGLAQTNSVLAAKMFKTRVLQPAELARAEPDSLVLQAAIDDMQLEALSLYKRLNSGVLRIFALDDLLTQPPKKSSFYKYSYKDAKPRLRKALSLSDRLIVTTQPLAELCKGMIDDIRIIPNCLERAIWGGVSSLRMQGKKPRVGWAGAQQHEGDLGLIHEVVKATAHEVDWIFFGMCPNELRPHIREFHDFVLSFDEYPAKLASLNLDLAVAPLEINAFNEAKSNLRLLEYGILGWPVVCTDIFPYHGAPVTRVPNQAEAWIDAIRERVHDLGAAYKEGDQLREWVLNHYMLEDHLDEWMAALLRS